MRYIVASLALLLADQITKYEVRSHLTPGQSLSVLGDFFRIEYVRNTGAAFGMLAGKEWILQLLPLALIACVFGYLLWHHREMHWICISALAMIMVGGIGNLIDRVLYGFVTDMISFSIFPPVFNIADIAVTGGCFVLMIYIIFAEKLLEK